MEKIKFILVLIFFTIFIQVSYAQDNQRIEDLLTNVKILEDKPSDTSKVVFRKGCSDRKYSIKSNIDAESIISKHKIKYFRSGAKKEKTKYFKRSTKGSILVLNMVRINGLATYIKYCETDLNIKREMVIVKEEVLMDGKYYQMRTYDKYGKWTSTENINQKEKINVN